MIEKMNVTNSMTDYINLDLVILLRPKAVIINEKYYLQMFFWLTILSV